MEFNPTKNEGDKELLDNIIQESIKKIAQKSMNAGVININKKEYHFKGINAWVEVYIKWFERKKKELSDKVDGYSKADRWDGVGRVILEYSKLPEDERKAKADKMVEDIMKVMVEPDKIPMDPIEVTKELDVIYKTILDQVFLKLFDEQVELDEVPALWEGFIRHIASQQASATNFYLVSPEMSTIIFEAGQRVKESLQVDS